MAPALFLASGDLNPWVLGALFVSVAVFPAVVLLQVLISATELNVFPLPVLSVVTACTVPVRVLKTGLTTALVLVTGSMTLLLTMAVLVTKPVLVTKGVLVTNTVVVKWSQIKNPGNQKPNQKTG